MENETLAFIASFIAVICVVVAYFMKKIISFILFLIASSIFIITILRNDVS